MNVSTISARVLVVIFCGIITSGQLQAATHVVTNSTDSGAGSLRDTIAAAMDGDVITFTNTLSGAMITLTSGQIQISDNLTIIGPGPSNLVVSGNDNSRVFETDSGTTNSISGLTIRDGRSANGGNGNPGDPGESGGGVYNRGTLTLSNCVITANESGEGGNGNNGANGVVGSPNGKNGRDGGDGGDGGAIYNEGDLMLILCTVTNNNAGKGGKGGNGGDAILTGNRGAGGDGGNGGNGGAIYSLGDLVLSGCILDANSSGDRGGGGSRGSGSAPGADGNVGLVGLGGGIHNNGTNSINNSTLSGNTARQGGGVYNSGSSLTLNQSTLSGNSAANQGSAIAQGGGIYSAGSGSILVVNQSTLSENTADDAGGGISMVAGTFGLTNSIVAGNAAGAAPDLNLTGSTFLPGGNNITNTTPLLGPLDDYGGPTPTMLPLPASPAVDGCVSGTEFITDQRGLPRVVGPFADIGASESSIDPVVTTLADDGAGSLRRMLLLVPNGTTITFTNTLSYPTNITLTSGPLLLTTNLTIVGPGPANLAISGNNAGRVFETDGGITNNIAGLTIRNGHAADGSSGNPGTDGQPGGGIYNRGTLTLSNCVITANWSGDGGNGNDGADGTVGDPDGNKGKDGGAGGEGGAIYSEGPLTLFSCTVTANNSGKGGKGGNGGDGNGLLGNGGNGGDGADGGDGGAIYGLSQLLLTDCTVEANISGDRGGGGSKGTGTVGDGADGNVGFAGDGGGIYNNGTNTLNNSTLLGNTAQRGGGVYNDGTGTNTLTVNQCTFSGNNATAPAAADAQGGAIYNSGGGSLLAVNQSTFFGNTSDDGGGGISTSTGTFSLTNSIVAGNTAASGPNNISGSFSGVNNLVGGDPLLAAFGDYGGPTWTMPPLTNSPALDAGNDSSTNMFAADQRGLPRLIGQHVDIGAVELVYTLAAPSVIAQPATEVEFLNATLNATVHPNGALTGYYFEYGTTTNYSFTTAVNTLSNGIAEVETILTGLLPSTVYHFRAVATNSLGTTFGDDLTFLTSGLTVVTNTSDDVSGSLREAIVNSSSGDVIRFDSALSDATILLTNGHLLLDKNLTIDASALPDGITLDGNANGRIFQVDVGTTNLLTGLTLTNGETENGVPGGAIRNLGMLTVSNCVLTGNRTGAGSGGIDGSFQFGPDGEDGEYGSAGGHGGAIYNEGLLNMVACEITVNHTGNGGSGGDGGTTTQGTLLTGTGGKGGDGGNAGKGGGIYNVAAMTLVDCIVQNNYTGTGGSGGWGGAAATNGILMTSANGGDAGHGGHGGDGGGIYNEGLLTLNTSIIKNNDTGDGKGGGPGADGNVFYGGDGGNGGNGGNGGDGGGIFCSSSGQLILTASTLSGNSTGEAGSAGLRGEKSPIVNGFNPPCFCYENGQSGNAGREGHGGGLGNAGTLTLNSSTLSGNIGKRGGGIHNTLTLHLNNSTLSGNSAISRGGGIYNDTGGTLLTLTNTIVAGNMASSDTNIFGAFSGSFNLTSGDPHLAPLDYYGGFTQTMPPLSSSPALDAGDDSVTNTVLTDQRGLPRLAGSQVDIGAVESNLERVVWSAGDDGPGTLRQIVDDEIIPGTTITFSNSLSGATILLTNGQLILDNMLNIDASALPGGITLDGYGASRIFQVLSGQTVELTALTLTNGSSTGNGGGIWNNGTLTLNRCTIAGNSAVNGGGAWNKNTMTVNQCTLNGNSASVEGGGIYNKDSGNTLVVNQSTLSGNFATTGGGIRRNGGSVSITNTIVAGNTASSDANMSGVFSGSFNLTSGDPMLQPVGYYGGPTPTMPPLSGSPTIDYGSDFATNTFVTDQRGSGFTRLSGLHVDIGAAEFTHALVAPSVVTLPASDVVFTNATLNATVNPNGAVTDYYFEYGTTTNYGSATPIDTLSAGIATVSANLSGLSLGLVYHYRAVATNTLGVTFGEELTFATGATNFVSNTNDFGPGSLRDIVENSITGEIIAFDLSLSGSTIVLTSGELILDKQLNIDASALPDGITLDGNGTSRIIEVMAGRTVVLDSLTLTNGNTLANGGGISNAGDLTVNRCTIVSSSADNGGGIMNRGTLAVNQCTFSANSASSEGGGICSSNTLVVMQSTFSGNSATTGGGIRRAGGAVSITNTIVAGNTASSGGNISGSFSGNFNLTSGDPLLEPLGDYGGPTPSMPPLFGSPAIDFGTDSTTNTFATDQRGIGFTRQSGLHVDIGAVESAYALVAPSVVTLPASGVALTDATLNATVNPNGAIADYYFEYGTTTNYGSSTATNTLSAGITAVNANLNSLLPGGAYHFRAVATNSLGITFGEDVTFHAGGFTNIVANANDNGPGSLREAIDVSLSGDFISFDFGLSGSTIVLTNGQLLLDKHLNIIASELPGGIILNGNGTSRIIEVMAGRTVVLDSLTITNGNANLGGGILNSGTLELNNSTLSDNSAIRGGGIYAISGSLTVNESILSSNSADQSGGGIYVNSGSLTVEKTTLSGNIGGGIYNRGDLSVSQSTISGNIGDGIYSHEDLSVSQSTLSGNTGRGIESSKSMNVRQSTVVGNWGGLRSRYTFYLHNSIVTQNNSFNISFFYTSPYNYVYGGSNLTEGNHLLQSLGDYGGPTQTRPPTAYSPAIDSGNDTYANTFNTDQRGLPRIARTQVDIGAVEYQVSSVITSPADSGIGTLRDALTYLTSGTTITFTNTLSYPANVTLTSGPLLLTTNWTIVGPGPNNLTISGNNNSRVFESASDTTNFISGLTIADGHAPDGGNGNPGDPGQNGGGIYNLGTLTLSNCVISFSQAGDGGGGNNGADGVIGSANGKNGKNGGRGGHGGGIYNAGTLSLIASMVTNNESGAGGDGGHGGDARPAALNADGGDGGNGRDGGEGAGIYNAGLLELTACTFIGNQTGSGGSRGNKGSGSGLGSNGQNGNKGSDGLGGGIYNTDDLVLNNSTLFDNTAKSGGGVGNNGTLELNSTTVIGNAASDGAGGGLLISSGTGSLTNTIVTENTASSGSANISGSFSGTDNLTSGYPLLAPLDDYGGLTLTMPPLPGSPTIDAGGTTTLTTDQRGLPRVVNGTVDIGAAEFQGYADLVLQDSANLSGIWNLDSDGDGNAFGVEFALGTDWTTADANHPANLTAVHSNGVAGAVFGYNPNAASNTAWILTRSLDLTVTNSFVEIYRYDGPSGITSNSVPVFITETPTSTEVLDLSDPQPTNAFYRFEAEPSP